MDRLPQTALTLGLLASGALAGAEVPIVPGLQVRVYDYAKVPQSVWKRAEAVAADIFREAGVEMAWLVCPGGGDGRSVHPDCRTPMGPLEVSLRALPSAPETLSNRPDVLGRAHVPKGGGVASYADIYVDRIGDLADRLRTAGSHTLTRVDSQRRVLGVVAAHELGHLILGSTSHTRRGLMRRCLGQKELKRTYSDQLRFRAKQVGRLHAQLRARLPKGLDQEPVILAFR